MGCCVPMDKGQNLIVSNIKDKEIRIKYPPYITQTK